MFKRSLLAASLAVLAFGAVRPASADPKFLDTYGGIYSARPLMGIPDDDRPKDAIMAQKNKEGKDSSFYASPFYRFSRFHFGNGDGFFDVMQYGGSFTYANVRSEKHPIQLQANIFNTNLDVHFRGRHNETDISGGDFVGKLGLMVPKSAGAPAVSFVGRYQKIENAGSRVDALLAVDQRVAQGLFLTGNVGYGLNDPDSNPHDTDAIVSGVGFTWSPSRWPKLSLSGDYTLDNALDGEDFWSASLAYSFTNRAAIRVGGGKNSTIFANYVGRFNF
jgi:hypothetical protein